MQNKHIECNFFPCFWSMSSSEKENPQKFHRGIIMKPAWGQQQEGWPFYSQPTDLCHFLLKGQPTAAGIYCHLLPEPTLQESIRHPCHNSVSFFQKDVQQQKKGKIKKSLLLAQLHMHLYWILAVSVGNADLPDQHPCCRLFLLPHSKFEVFSLLPVHRQTSLQSTWPSRGALRVQERTSLSSSLFQVLGHWTFWWFNINVLVSVLAKKLSATTR